MKNAMKRMVTAFVAVAVALTALVAVAPAQALAATGSGTLTVSSANSEFNNKTVTAWKMFDAVPSANGANASYTLTAEWEPFFKGIEGMGALSGEELSRSAVDHITKMKGDEGAVAAFAKKASDWAKQQKLAATKTAVAQKSGGNYVATFEGLAFGYYVVSPAGGSTASRGTDAILVNVVKAQNPIELKSAYPTVDKKVEGSNHADAQIGDTLKFKLTSAVPNMAEYTEYAFTFKDTLSKGLTLNKASIVVKIADTPLVLDTDYTVETTGGNGQPTNLVIAMKNFKNLHQKDAGKALTVEYSANVNEHAVAGMDDAGNTVKLEYSNNPSDPSGKGETTEVVTHGYTFEFDIAKVDGETKAALAGVKFQLKKKGGDIVKLVVENPGDAGNPAVVRPAKADELDTASDTVTTPESGKITFRGLDAGIYELVETETLDGYNKLTGPVEIKIDAMYKQDGTLESWTVNGNGQNIVTIENNKGTLLPGTGGMGTVLFTLAGAALIGYGVYRKRAAQNVA